MKTRQHVSIRKEIRSDNGAESFVLTWTPTPGDRRRKTFKDGAEAENEADRIESILSRGLLAAAKPLKAEIAALIMLCEELTPGIKPAEVVQFYLKHHSAAWHSTATVALIGDAFMASRSSPDKFSIRHIQTVRYHVRRFVKSFGPQDIAKITPAEIDRHLETEVGGAPKTRFQHLGTICSLFRWARDHDYLTPGKATAAALVTPPTVTCAEHEVFSPDEMLRLLAAAPPELVPFIVLGQFSGVRAAERERMLWSDWREEDSKFVLSPSVTKTGDRRLVDVPDNLTAWLTLFKGRSHEKMVAHTHPYRVTSKVAATAGVEWKPNALRAGYASYHLELFDNAPLTSKNCGHSISMLNKTYKSIVGVSKKTASEMFAITPTSVLAYAAENNLPTPPWEGLKKPDN